MDGDKEVNAPFAQNVYTLTVNVDGPGSVTLDPVGGSYVSGTVVDLTALADAGWSFAGWGGGGFVSEFTTSVTMDGDKVVTATFTQNVYTLTVNVVGQGSVTLDPVGGSYVSGTVVDLTALADAGWSFAGWSGDASGSELTTSVTMDGDKVVTATFTQNVYTLTVNVVGQGSVTLDPVGGSYVSGTVVDLTALADAGWSFAGWSGDASGSELTTSVTMDGDKVVAATFTQNVYTLTVNVVGQGSVTL